MALLMFVALLARSSAFAAETLALDRALEQARRANPEVLAARQELIVAEGRLQKARYWNLFNPEIEGGAANRRFDDGGDATQRSGGVALEVEVAGQRGLRIDEARRNLARVEAEVANAERLLGAQVKEAFYRALYSLRRLELARRIEDLNRRLRDASAERFKAGEVSKLEANLATVRSAQSRRETLGADRDHRRSVRELERLIGAEPVGAVEPAGQLELAIRPVEASEDALLEEALRLRPDLRARDAEIERVDAEQVLTRRLIVPNPTLRGTYDEETESAGSRDRIVGGAISIALPVFDRKQADLTALAGLRNQAAYERAATLLAVKADVRDAFRSYEAAREAVRAFQSEAVGPIDESFRFIETAYREGKIDLLELIVAQNDLVDAQVSYLESLRDHAEAAVALERAVGDTPQGVTTR